MDILFVFYFFYIFSLQNKNIKGAFGHTVTQVNTIFGNLHFVADPLLRGPWENYCVAVDMANVAYRPLKGNGVSRDTHIITNVQNNNVDGRKDRYIKLFGHRINLDEIDYYLRDNGFITATIFNDNKFTVFYEMTLN